MEFEVSANARTCLYGVACAEPSLQVMLFCTVETIYHRWATDIDAVFIAGIIVVHAHFVGNIVVARNVDRACPCGFHVGFKKVLLVVPPKIGLRPRYIGVPIIVEFIEMHFSSHIELSLAKVFHQVHAKGIVAELLLFRLRHRRRVLSVPGAIVLRPGIHFKGSIVHQAIARRTHEIELRPGSGIEVAAPVAKSVCGAISIGKHRGDFHAHCCGFRPIGETNHFPLVGFHRLQHTRERTLFHGFFHHRHKVFGEGDFFLQIFLRQSRHRHEGGSQDAHIYFFHNAVCNFR